MRAFHPCELAIQQNLESHRLDCRSYRHTARHLTSPMQSVQRTLDCSIVHQPIVQLPFFFQRDSSLQIGRLFRAIALDRLAKGLSGEPKCRVQLLAVAANRGRAGDTDRFGESWGHRSFWGELGTQIVFVGGKYFCRDVSDLPNIVGKITQRSFARELRLVIRQTISSDLRSPKLEEEQVAGDTSSC